jgi:hypothetical protein
MRETITLNTQEQKRLMVLNRLVMGQLTAAEAAEVLDLSERQVRRLLAAYRYVWDYAGQMQLMRYFWDAAVALDPAASTLDEGQRFPICQPEPLMQLFRAEGLRAVAVRMIDIPTTSAILMTTGPPFLVVKGLLLAIRCHSQRSDAVSCESAFVPRS